MIINLYTTILLIYTQGINRHDYSYLCPYVASIGSSGEKIGYLPYNWGLRRSSVEIYNENILIEHNQQGSSWDYLWIKEGYELPDVFEVTIRNIEIREEVVDFWRSYYQGKEIVNFSDKDIKLENLVDKEIIQYKKLTRVTFLYFNIKEIENIAYRLPLYTDNENFYLPWEEKEDGLQWNPRISCYKVNAEYESIFSFLL